MNFLELASISHADAATIHPSMEILKETHIVKTVPKLHTSLLSKIAIGPTNFSFKKEIKTDCLISKIETRFSL